MPHAALDFSGGETYQRFTITEPLCTAHSKILTSVQRRDVLTADDRGWVFIPNVVAVADGSFEVIVQALPIDTHPTPNNDFPTEYTTLVYSIST